MNRTLSIILVLLFLTAMLAGAGCAQTNTDEPTLETAATDTADAGETTAVSDDTAADTKATAGDTARETTDETSAVAGETETMITDLLGREVTIPANANRFAAIGPGSLRLYCYVADVAQLAGIESFELNDISGRPYMIANPSLLELDIIGPGGPNNAPDAERILVAGPDVIFSMYNIEASAADDLQQKTGIPVVALSYGVSEMFDPLVDQSIELIGKITGNETRAAQVIGLFAAYQEDLLSRAANVADADTPLAYMGGMGMRGAHGIESTTGNYSIFNAVGARNAVSEAGIDAYALLDKEKIIDLDPDFIFIDGSGLALVYQDYENNAAYYNSLQAFQNDRVFLQLPYNFYYTNIGVAIANAYFVGSILYPDQFSDIDPAVRFDQIMVSLVGAAAYEAMAEAYYGGYQQLLFD